MQTAEYLISQILNNRKTNPKEAAIFCEELEKLGQMQNDNRLLGVAGYYKGEVYYLTNKLDLMFAELARAIVFLNASEQWDLVARSYNLLAVTSVNKGNVPMALDYYLSGRKCCMKYGMETSMCSISCNIGNLYKLNGLYEEAEKFFVEACQNLDKCDNPEEIESFAIIIYGNLAGCYMKKGNLDKAKEYIDKINTYGRHKFKVLDEVCIGCVEAEYFECLGDTKCRDERIDSILSVLDGSLPIMDMIDDLLDLCKLSVRVGREDAFWEIQKKLYPVARNNGMVFIEKNLLELKIEYYKQNHETESYIRGISRHYELLGRMEKDNAGMMVNMIHMRVALEQEKNKRRKIKQENIRLIEKSETDQLTGIPNRYKLTEQSQKMMDDCFRRKLPFSVEILDIDFFKQYNDTYGHQVGDVCIKSVANVLRKIADDFGEDVFCARYGGDEFIVLYGGLLPAEVERISNKIKNDIESMRIEHRASECANHVTVSQGICQHIPDDGNKSWDFLHVADVYLYEVKKNGRNGICIGNLFGEVDGVKIIDVMMQ